MSRPSERQQYSTLERLDNQIDAWRQTRVEEYSRELGIIEQMRNEIKHLRQKVVNQDRYCNFLTTENVQLKRELGSVKQELADLKPASEGNARPEEVFEANKAESLPAALAKLDTVDPASKEFMGLVAEVDASIRPVHGIGGAKVYKIMKSKNQQALQRRFGDHLGSLNDASLNMRLYYGGHHLEKILAEGFSMDDIGDPYGLSTYGQGFYFTPYFSKAHHYSEGSGKVLLCLVTLGNSETVVSTDPKRAKPGKSYDSICVPGRKLPLSGSVKGALMEEIVSGNAMEEYVVFHPAQILPMYLVSYDTILHE